MQTHRSSNGYFVITFPTTHASSLRLTFPFPSPKPTAHFNNWSRALVLLISTFSPRYTHSSVHQFLFSVRPKFSPSICWVLFWYFFFPCSSIFCVVFTETLAHLVMNSCLFMPLFFTLYSSIAFMPLLFCFYFIFLEVSLSCSFVTTMVLWTMSALLCGWLGEKKNYLYRNFTKTSLQIPWGLDLVFLIIIF